MGHDHDDRSDDAADARHRHSRRPLALVLALALLCALALSCGGHGRGAPSPAELRAAQLFALLGQAPPPVDRSWWELRRPQLVEQYLALEQLRDRGVTATTQINALLAALPLAPGAAPAEPAAGLAWLEEILAGVDETLAANRPPAAAPLQPLAVGRWESPQRGIVLTTDGGGAGPEVMLASAMPTRDDRLRGGGGIGGRGVIKLEELAIAGRLVRPELVLVVGPPPDGEALGWLADLAFASTATAETEQSLRLLRLQLLTWKYQELLIAGWRSAAEQNGGAAVPDDPALDRARGEVCRGIGAEAGALVARYPGSADRYWAERLVAHCELLEDLGPPDDDGAPTNPALDRLAAGPGQDHDVLWARLLQGVLADDPEEQLAHYADMAELGDGHLRTLALYLRGWTHYRLWDDYDEKSARRHLLPAALDFRAVLERTWSEGGPTSPLFQPALEWSALVATEGPICGLLEPPSADSRRRDRLPMNDTDAGCVREWVTALFGGDEAGPYRAPLIERLVESHRGMQELETAADLLELLIAVESGGQPSCGQLEQRFELAREQREFERAQRHLDALLERCAPVRQCRETAVGRRMVAHAWQHLVWLEGLLSYRASAEQRLPDELVTEAQRALQRLARCGEVAASDYEAGLFALGVAVLIGSPGAAQQQQALLAEHPDKASEIGRVRLERELLRAACQSYSAAEEQALVREIGRWKAAAGDPLPIDALGLEGELMLALERWSDARELAEWILERDDADDRQRRGAAQLHAAAVTGDRGTRAGRAALRKLLRRHHLGRADDPPARWEPARPDVTARLRADEALEIGYIPVQTRLWSPLSKRLGSCFYEAGAREAHAAEVALTVEGGGRPTSVVLQSQDPAAECIARRIREARFEAEGEQARSKVLVVRDDRPYAVPTGGEGWLAVGREELRRARVRDAVGRLRLVAASAQDDERLTATLAAIEGLRLLDRNAESRAAGRAAWHLAFARRAASQLALAHAHLTAIEEHRGEDTADPTARYRVAVELADLGPDDVARLQARAQLAQSLAGRGAIGEALAVIEEATALAPPPRERAALLRIVANTQLHAGRPALAEPAARDALELDTRAGDQLGQLLGLAALGNAAEASDRLSLALESYRRAGGIAQRGRLHQTLSRLRNNMAVVADRSDRVDLAQRLYVEALAARRGAQDPRDVATILDNLGYVLMGQGRLEPAEQLQRAALRVFERLDDRPGQIHALLGLGLTLTEQERSAAAIEVLGRAKELASGAEAAADRLAVGLNLGLAHQRAGDHARAVEELGAVWRAAGDQGPGAVAWRAGDALARSLRATARDAEAAGIEAQVVETIEALRAREETREIRAGRLGAADFVFDRLIAEAAARGEAGTVLALIERRRSRALVEALEQRGRATDAPAATEFVPPRLEQIRAALDRDEALLAFDFSPRGGVAVVVDRERAVVRALAARHAELERAVAGYRACALARQPCAQRFAEQVAAAVLAPALDAAPGVERWVVIVDGALHYFPLAAAAQVLDAAPPDAIFARVPSIALFLRQRAAAGAGPPGQALVLADPATDAPPLAAARTEGRTVAARFGGEALIGPLATERAFKAGAGAADVLHVAAHAVFDPDEPWASHLLLAAGDGEDGRVEAAEVAMLDLRRTSLVVLSACSTGMQRERPGREMLGLTGAFFEAGATSLLVSLWPVADRSTELLMDAFYRELQGGAAPAVALGRAQRELRESAEHGAPFFWAPFVLVGTGR